MATSIVKVHLQGTRPLLLNPPTDELLERLWSGQKTPSTKGQKTKEEHCAGLLIRGPDGRMGIPVGYLRAALVTGGRVVKNGRFAISTATSTKLPLCLTIEDDFLPFVVLKDARTGEVDESYDPEMCWQPDMRRGTNPTGGVTGGVMVTIVRPKIWPWGVVATFNVDDRQISHPTFLELLKMTGKVAGVGDFRPGCKGDFGIFTPVRYEVLEVRKDDDDVVMVGMDKVATATPAVAKKVTGKRGATAKARRNGQADEADVADAEEVMAAR